MSAVLYPGSFDPITYGHMDLLVRACELFDRVVIGVASNAAKSPMFSLQERQELIRKSIVDANIPILSKAEVVVIRGLLVDAIEQLHVNSILRGLRAFSDFEYELKMAELNRDLRPGYETIFMLPGLGLSVVSSSSVKELAMLGANITRYVPRPVLRAIKERVAEIKQIKEK